MATSVNVFGVVLFCGALFVGTLCQTPKVRICVPKSLSRYCEDMEQDRADAFTCVSREDRFDCTRAVQLGEADVTAVDAQGIYVAGRTFGLEVLAFEEVEGLPYKYKGVALVKKSLQLSSVGDLKGKRSCHTGVHRTVGWQIPVAILQSRGYMTPNCEGELATVVDFFNKSCAPHTWSPDPIVDAELKKKYPSLCELCDNPETCTRGDKYGGYQGSLLCLAEGRGDIAFSKTSSVEEFLNEHPDQKDELDFLCLDGSRVPASDGVEAACDWGKRPTSAFVVSGSLSNSDKERIYGTLRDAFLSQSLNITEIQSQERPEWFTKVLISSSKVTNILLATGEQKDWRGYLGDFRLTIDRYFGGCQPKVLKFCTTSDIEQSKCSDLSNAAFARRSNVELRCEQAQDRSSCIQKIKEGEADLIMLDGGDIYKAGRYSDLVPVASEIYGKNDNTYFAVAVVKENSNITSIQDLSGRRSCHTGIGRTAGWNIPVGTLIDGGYIPKEQCDRALAVSNFFSASCAPGANDPKYNPNLSGAEKLCRQCIGDESGENKCSRGSAERYSSYAGAFRCLAEGNGDVSFIKHSTVPDYTDGKSDLPWTSGLRSSDYKLLCLDGGRRDVQDYKICSLAKVPSHYGMTSGSSTREKRLEAAEFLAIVSKFLGESSLDFNSFKVYRGKSDLLFKSSTTALRAVNLNSTYQDVLGDYFNVVEAIDPSRCSS